MSRIIKTEVFQYAELDDKAKAKARDWYREVSSDDNEFQECPTNELKTICEMLGFTNVETRYSGFWSQGDGASFKADYAYKAATRQIRKAFPKDEKLHSFADRLRAVQAPFKFKLVASIFFNSLRYCHAYTMDCDAWDSRSGPRDHLEAEDEIRDVARDLAKWFYAELEKSYNDSVSDEQIVSNIEANEYEFTAEGKRFV